MMKHIKIELDFIPVEERLPERDMGVELLLSEEKTNPTIYRSHRPTGKKFQRRVQGSFRLERTPEMSIWFTPYMAYFADSRCPITHWAEIPGDKQ